MSPVKSLIRSETYGLKIPALLFSSVSFKGNVETGDVILGEQEASSLTRKGSYHVLLAICLNRFHFSNLFVQLADTAVTPPFTSTRQHHRAVPHLFPDAFES